MNIQEWQQRIKSAKIDYENRRLTRNDLRLFHSEFLIAWAIWYHARKSAPEYIFHAQLAETKQIDTNLHQLEFEILGLFKIKQKRL